MSYIKPKDITLAQEKDNDAYRRIYEYISAIARRISPKNLDCTNEIAQKSLVKLLNGAISTYDPSQGDPDKWLTIVVNSVWKDYRRAKRRKKEVSYNNRIGDSEDSYERIIQHIDETSRERPLMQEDAERFEATLEHIFKHDPEVREAMEEMYVRGMTLEGMSAARNDLPISMIKARLRKGREAMRLHYKGH